MVIDSHTHLSIESVLFQQWARRENIKFSVDGMLDEMKKNKVEKALVFASYLDEFLLTNEGLEGLVDKHKELIPVASLPDGINADLSQCLSNFRDLLSIERFKAIKIYTGYIHKYPYDKSYEKIFEFCTDAKVPIIFHTGDTFLHSGKLRYSLPINFDGFAVDHPDLKIVLAHMGNPFIEDAAAVIYKNENVYGDLSCAVTIPNPYKKGFLRDVKVKLKKALNYIGNADKVMYGSDWPLATMHQSLDLVKGLHLSRADYKKVTEENAKRVFML